MIEPTQSDLRRLVVYDPGDGGNMEDGIVTGFSDDYVFVRYSDQDPLSHGKATPRERLFWAHPRLVKE